jgi:hypothetical protein
VNFSCRFHIISICKVAGVSVDRWTVNSLSKQGQKFESKITQGENIGRGGVI